MKLAILIVTYNSEKTIEAVLGRLKSEGLESSVFVLDNASTDKSVEIINRFNELTVIESRENLGFCKGNNLILNRAYNLSYSHFLFLNPDAAPLEGSIEKLREVVENSVADAFTPKLIRCSELMEPINPPVIDAAGIYFTTNFRHLDRGSGELDMGQYDDSRYVTGGTGAALLISRTFVEKISFISDDGSYELFDERFFAYREDAELALRAKRYGFKYLYVPSAVFCHVRKVVPDNRKQISAFINALSVRNRMLLLLSHYNFSLPIFVQFSTLLRNLQVFTYAILFEPQSCKLLFQSLRQLSTHLKRRKEISNKSIRRTV